MKTKYLITALAFILSTLAAQLRAEPAVPSPVYERLRRENLGTAAAPLTMDQLGDPSYPIREAVSQALAAKIRRTPPDAESLDYFEALRFFGATTSSAEARRRAFRIVGSMGTFAGNPWAAMACGLKTFVEGHETVRAMSDIALRLTPKIAALRHQLKTLELKAPSPDEKWQFAQKLRYLVFPELRETLLGSLRALDLTEVDDPAEKDPGVFKVRTQDGKVLILTFYSDSVSVTSASPLVYTPTDTNPYFLRATPGGPMPSLEYAPVVQSGFRFSNVGLSNDKLGKGESTHATPYVNLSPAPPRGPNGERGGWNYYGKQIEKGEGNEVRGNFPEAVESYAAASLLPRTGAVFHPAFRERLLPHLDDYHEVSSRAGLEWDTAQAAAFVDGRFEALMELANTRGAGVALPPPLSELASAKDDSERRRLWRAYFHGTNENEVALRQISGRIVRETAETCNAGESTRTFGPALQLPSAPDPGRERISQGNPRPDLGGAVGH